ncbi:hypothetical protein [Sphingobacterium siyangense]|uniref:hypothetical protein n=1 Tax=Sphingobacterium siyangense TaxID=459529 RepID=UPI002FD8E1CE
MNKGDYFQKLAAKLPHTENNNFIRQLEERCAVLTLEKNESLIAFQSSNRKSISLFRAVLSPISLHPEGRKKQ